LFSFPHPGPFSTPNLWRTFIAAFAGAFFGSVVVQTEEDVLQVLFPIDDATGYVAADQVPFVDPDVAVWAMGAGDGHNLQGFPPVA